MASDNAIFESGCALVIGASGGIGGKVAEVLAQDGADLALVCNRNEGRIKAIADSVETKATCHQADVTDKQSIETLIEQVCADHGRIHTLVWAAGPLVEQHALADTPEEEWDHAFAVESRGLFLAIQLLLPHMREKEGGSIVHLGSAGHLRWPPRDGLSVVPKAANESLIKGIAREEGQHGIRANSVLVGVINAGMFHELMTKGAFPDGWEEETKKMLSIKRWGQPEEIGYAVSWLASKRAGYVTGQQINVSGGFGI
ncbi:MAG: SDR family oxidoreductase [Parasphingorhabdus sp.]|uniref:SDR family NAD(P)-dependent oxidoreductase n=1 Tax=Parasphingorhabdus sp. TaxID=2709688 RepID=UPI0032674AC8